MTRAGRRTHAQRRLYSMQAQRSPLPRMYSIYGRTSPRVSFIHAYRTRRDVVRSHAAASLRAFVFASSHPPSLPDRPATAVQVRIYTPVTRIRALPFPRSSRHLSRSPCHSHSPYTRLVYLLDKESAPRVAGVISKRKKRRTSVYLSRFLIGKGKEYGTRQMLL